MGAKKKDVEIELTSVGGETPEEFVVTIEVNVGGKVVKHTFKGKSDAEIEAKVKRLKRSAKWFGSTLVRILLSSGKANDKLIAKIEKVMSKID